MVAISSDNQPSTKQQTSYNPGDKGRNFSKSNIPNPENKIPGPDLNATFRDNHKEPPPLSERIIRIIDHGLMGWGKMTPCNFGRTVYRVLEESLATGVHNYGVTVNHAAATITGAVGSARIRGIDPCSLQNIGITSIHQAPGIVSAACGEASNNASIAKNIAFAGNIAVILYSLYPAITSGDPHFATSVLTGLLASYGAHSQVHHHLHELCKKLPQQYQPFLEPWLQAFGQIGVTASMPGNPVKAADQRPTMNTETAEQAVPFSTRLRFTEPTEPGSHCDQSAGIAPNRGWSFFQPTAAAAAEIRHYLWREVSAFMAGNAGATCSNDRCPKPDSHNVTTFPETRTAGWLVAGKPGTQKQQTECLRYQSCAPDVRKLSDSPFISISETGDFVPAMGVLQCVRSLNSTGNSTTQHSPIEQLAGQSFNGTASNNPANFTCREPVTSPTLNAVTMPVTPTNRILAITFCEQQKDSKVYLFTYDTETKNMAIDIGLKGFTLHDQGNPMDILTERIRDTANMNAPRNDTGKKASATLDKGNLRQKRQSIGSPASNSSTVRFSPGNSTVSGKVEVFHNGTWGHIDSGGISNLEAGIICRQMQYPADHAVVINDDSLNSTGTNLNIIMGDVHCRGSEKKIQDCQYKEPDEQNGNLNNNKAVAVRCQPIGMNLGSVRQTGMITFVPDLLLNGTRATFPHGSIDNKGVSVLCHELGLIRGGKVSSLNCYHSWEHMSVQETFQCTGDEESILDCPKTELTPHQRHDQSDCLMVECPIQVDLRLQKCKTTTPVKNGTAGCPEARIIYREWGALLTGTPNDNEASVLCYALGYPRDGARFVNAQYHDNLNTTTYTTSLSGCNGSEKDITACNLVIYDGFSDPGYIQAINCPPGVQVSKECGAGPDNQFLVMWYGNRWLYIEGNGFDNNAASAVCRGMGLSGEGAIALQQNLSFPVVNFLGWQYLQCLGNETHFLDCELIGPQIHNGMNISAVMVICENQRMNSTVTGATCQITTTPAPSTTQPASPIRTETTTPDSMPNDDNTVIVICSLAGLTGLTGLTCIPCCLNARKLRELDPDSSPCQFLVNTIGITRKTPLYFYTRYEHLTESTDGLDTDDNPDQLFMTTAV
ncbi:hypothetical protein [Endozoicomonas sp.]|uniref:hypothetical protein n=1 Tax=Endozoicomonas sp. TaxID=1892382 RepID=UPI002887FF4E|nr:hypothetical protein [Endozoicomonas sp.]